MKAIMLHSELAIVIGSCHNSMTNSYPYDRQTHDIYYTLLLK